MTKAALNLENAIVLFGQFPALSGVDMEVKQGEKVVITGANGSGKTTLLRLLAGLLQISSGSGEVQGVNLQDNNLEALHSRVGLVSTKSMLYEDLSVLQNLKFWVRLLELPLADITAEIKDTLKYLGLSSDFWNNPVRQLSTGQKRRVVLALQVLKRPSLWLLDEPHAGLDKDGRDLLDEIIKSASSANASVVIASHEIERANKLADRSLELSGGRFK